VLADWNNTIVRLMPGRLVAKVGTSHFRDARLESLGREVAVAAYLAARGAPVVAPARDVPAGPYECEQLSLTLWEYAEPAPEVVADRKDLAAAITVVHRVLADFGGSLPVFTVELDDAGRLLDPHRSPALAAVDRRFLRDVISELRSVLPARGADWRPLHGSPHGANWLVRRDGPLLLDFETACRGPIEWDLAALSDEVLDCFPDADGELIWVMRRMRSVCVAAKCWVAPDRSPELREAASVHLRLLRGQAIE
jgi:hypothetical protein